MNKRTVSDPLYLLRWYKVTSCLLFPENIPEPGSYSSLSAKWLLSIPSFPVCANHSPINRWNLFLSHLQYDFCDCFEQYGKSDAKPVPSLASKRSGNSAGLSWNAPYSRRHMSHEEWECSD